MPFKIVRQDITKMKVDAIVNAANTKLEMGGGVCGMIFQASGESEMIAACEKLAPIQTGDAIITPGFNLPSKFVIHTAGPIYKDGKSAEEQALRSCYQNSMKLAHENGCKSMAFPLISSGIYGYPKESALAVATKTIREFLCEQDMLIYLVVFDKNAYEISKDLVGEIESYIDEYYVYRQEGFRRRLLSDELICMQESDIINYNIPAPCLAPNDEGNIKHLIENLDEPFSATLFRLIDSKGKTDVEVYKRANIDRKLFSKIRTRKGYTPSKRIVIALAIALELSLSETDNLLEKAGFSLSHSQKFDVIIEYFIVNRKYDIFEINEVLFKFDQPLLGA